MKLSRIFFSLSLCACIALAPFAARPALVAAAAPDDSYTLQKTTDAPPAEISAAIGATLAPGALKVVGPNGALCELWLRAAVPAAATPDTEIGVTFGQIAQGTFVGVIQFPADVIDYRQQHVKAGVYTLRYALNPSDGNHMGVAPQRDFLLAIPDALDTDPATLTYDQTVTLSRKAATTNHPSVWSLSEADATALPAVAHETDPDSWVIEFNLAVGSAAPTPMSLVIFGHADQA